jgi:ribosomal protein S18 acetylase RimI-like enzyme
MDSNSNYRLRDATPEDQPFLEQLFIETHRGELAPAGLDETQLLGLLRMQARGQRMSYAKDFPHAKDSIVLNEAGEPIGRFFVETAADYIHLLDIALLESVRGKGVGAGLIQELIDRARASDIPVRLRVQPANRALRLYQRLGFEVVSSGMQLEMELRPNAGLESKVLPSEEKAQGSLAGHEWEALVGKKFLLEMESQDALPTLLLTRFQRSRTYASSFTLTFSGPAQPILMQGSYALMLQMADSDEGAQRSWLLFIVPVGLEGEAMQYEAVFNL